MGLIWAALIIIGTIFWAALFVGVYAFIYGLTFILIVLPINAIVKTPYPVFCFLATSFLSGIAAEYVFLWIGFPTIGIYSCLIMLVIAMLFHLLCCKS